MSFTLIIVAITVIISLAAFNNASIDDNLVLWPAHMHRNPAEYHRLLSNGFIHANYMHLFFNMYALYIFGNAVETNYELMGLHYLFLALYLGGIVISSMPSFIKNWNNPYYRSLGASGGVAAVLFSYVYIAPWNIIHIWFIPVPSILGAVGYLVYSAYMSKHGKTNINHDAHFWGAVFGFVFTLLFDPTHGQIFFEQLIHPGF